MTKLRFSLIVTFSITCTLGYLAGHTADPGAWTLPVVVIVGGSLYASRSLFDQAHKLVRKLKWTKRSGLSQGSPKLSHSSNWKKP